MAKKQYMTPKAIDFSIEGMTGIGAGTCTDGDMALVPSCEDGNGANSACNPTGMFVSSGCSDGGFPHESGNICNPGGNAGNVCSSNGGNAAGGSGACWDGTAATNFCSDGGSGVDSACYNGDSDATFCGAGNSQAPRGNS